MFEARLAQGTLLKRLVEALKELVGEVNFNVSNEGISMQAMDNSHVCLVVMDLRRDGFEHYRCDRPMSMGIHVENLLKVLKCAGNNDIVTMKADDNGDILTLKFENQKQDRVWDFDLKLLSIDAETLDVPDEETSATISMPSAEYQRICRDLSSIGDTVFVSAVKDAVKLTTHGDVGTANVMLRHNNTQDKPEDNVLIHVSQPVTLTFALRYLNNFAKATPLASTVELSLTRDLPLCVNYKFEEDKGHIAYYLAPKIEDDEAMAEDEAESKP